MARVGRRTTHATSIRRMIEKRWLNVCVHASFQTSPSPPLSNVWFIYVWLDRGRKKEEVEIPIFKERFLSFPPSIPNGKILSKTCFELKGNPLPLRSGRLNRYIPAAFRLYSRKFHGGGRRIPRDGKKGMKGFEITATKRSMGGNNPFLYSRRDTPYHPCDTVWFRHGFSSLKRPTSRSLSFPSLVVSKFLSGPQGG